jgi:hypothetical protein
MARIVEANKFLRCEHQSFGTPVLEALRREQGEVGPETKLAISSLKNVVTKLHRLPQKKYRLAAEDIESSFALCDKQDALDNLDVTRPVGRSILSWLERANRYDFIAFCEWNEEHRKRVHRQIMADKPKLVADTMRRTQGLVGAEIFPLSALGIMKRSTKTKIRTLDSFEAGSEAIFAYYDKKTVGLYNMYDNPEELSGISFNMRRTVFHEWMHAVGRNTRYGFHNGLTRTAGKDKLHWLEEAFVTDITRIATQPDVKDTVYHVDFLPHPYEGERRLLSAVRDSSPEPLGFDLLSAAFFERRYSKPEGARKQVELGLYAGFQALFPEHGEQGFLNFNRAYNAEIAWLEADDIVVPWADEAERRLYGRDYVPAASSF